MLLLHKLRHSYHVSGIAHQWFTSYLHDRQQRVIVNGKSSSWTCVTSGTPEGGLLSPLLFAMFINDLPLQIQSSCLMFADDVKIYRNVSCAADADLLQDDLHRLCRWSHVWKLSLNPAKCKSFRITLKKSHIETTYFVGNTALEHVDTIRDLGVILDSKLTFRPHIESTIKKANRALGLLIRSFQTPKLRGYINLATVRVSYYAHVRSVLEYCSVVWAGAAKTHLDRIERVQFRFMRWLNGCSPRADACACSEYTALLRHYGVCSLYSRRVHHDILFARNVLTGRIASAHLLQCFSLSAPIRVGRRPSLLYVPYARVVTVKDGLFVRAPRLINDFVQANPASDMFHDSFAVFKNSVCSYVKSLQM